MDPVEKQAIRFAPVSQEMGDELANIRTRAMKPSLVALGRYDPTRVRERFLVNFRPQHTSAIYLNDDLAGFLVLVPYADHLHLDHLYIAPDFQRRGIGAAAIAKAKHQASQSSVPLRVTALRDSPANPFYKKHRFTQIAEAEFDIFYEFRAR